MLLHEKLKEFDIILASQSPRRKQLLSEMGIEFKVIIRDIDESYDANLLQHDVAMYIARKKAAAFIDLISDNTIVITADTIVCLENKIIGKPNATSEAFNILKQLSGNRHTVITGVCIKSNLKEVTFFKSSDVYFRTLTDEEISYYIKTFKPMDKAGAYGIQEWIGFIGLERIDGSYHNVMGLPTSELYYRLQQFIA